jgi:membrane protease subunit HflC
LRDRFGKIVNSSLRDTLAKSSLTDVLSENRAGIMAEIADEVEQKAPEFGIDVLDVRIGRTELPQETRQAVFNRMTTERDRQAKELRAEGAEEAARIRADADKERTIILADAERKAEISRGEGEARRTKILASAFEKDPGFFAFYRSMQAYDESLGDGGATLLLSPDSAFFKYFESLPGQ